MLRTAGVEDDEEYVALRKESVDRNNFCLPNLNNMEIVALRKESVDRNVAPEVSSKIWYVALRKESVDRNFACCIIKL